MSLPKHIREVYKRSTCLFTKAEIETALDNMAKKIHDALEEKDPLFLSVMIGGLVLTGNLLPRLDFPLELDYIHATRYGGEKQGKEIIWKAKPTAKIENRTVLVIDDILDGGITLQTIIDYCKAQKAKEVLCAVLLDKEHVRLPNGLPHADFVGLTIENHYVFGYGLDYKEYLRNAPGIYKVDPQDE